MHGFNYQQLSPEKQALFDTLYKQLDSGAQAIVLHDYKMEFSDASRVYRSVFADNPQFFWLAESCSGTLWTGEAEKVLDFRPKWRENITPADLPEKRRELEEAVTAVAAQAKRYPDTYHQVLFVHDYLIDHTDYAQKSPDCFGAYGCFINKEAVCMGYTAAFQCVMNALHIPCGRVTGGVGKDRMLESTHIWNYVCIDGEYYFVDLTCDDPVEANALPAGQLNHDFFCLDEQELALSHHIDCEGFVPKCTATKYNYFKYHHLCLDAYRFETLKKIAEPQVRQKGEFYVKFSTAAECKKAQEDLLENHRVGEIAEMSREVQYRVSFSGLILQVKNKT